MTASISRAVVVVAAGLIFAACAEPAPEEAGPARPPGFSGPVPSPEAQERLRRLDGRPVPADFAGVTEAGWVFGGFAVVPSEAAPGGKGPVVSMFRSGERRDIHLPDDAAVDRLLAEFDRAAAPR